MYTNNNSLSQIHPQEFKSELKKIEERDNPNNIGMFELQKANDAISEALSMPDLIQLYPDLILENEFSILFADSGIGKTVFAIQTAIYIAEKGTTVLYLDLELNKKQFQRRFTTDNGVVFKLPETLYRVGFAKIKKVPNGLTYEEYFFQSLIESLNKTSAKVVYLDNLTKLAAGDTDSAKSAIPILERLNDIKAEYNLTIIVIEHNKKVDGSRPIQLNDLQGSKMKSNLVDAVFTIGRSSKDYNLRYIKQVKVRDGEVVYDTENVKLVELSKEKGYLSFTDKGTANELEHLKEQSANEIDAKIQMAIQLHKDGKTQREIANEMGLALGTINKYLKRQGS